MNALGTYIILTLVSIVFCQYRDQVYSTSRTKDYPSTSRSSWSGSTRFAQSRTAVSSSRYDHYQPLDAYRTQYGSILGQNDSAAISSRHQNQPYDPSLSRSRNTNVQYGTTRYQGSTSARRDRNEYERNGPSVQATTSPPHIESSLGLTHYTTLNRNRQRPGESRGSVSRPYTPPQGRLHGRLGKKKQRIAGEGYGEAYLEWSEYGLGETVQSIGYSKPCLGIFHIQHLELYS